MGCFLGCFGVKKDRRRRRSPRKKSPVVPTPAQESSQPLRKNPSPTQSTTPEKLTPNVSLKKHITDAQEADGSPPNLRENREQGSFSNSVRKVTFDLNVKTYEEFAVDDGTDDEEENQVVGEDGKPQEEGNNSQKSCAFPKNHRYQNCNCSDEDVFDDDEEDEFEDCDSDEEDNEGRFEEAEEESYDSFFSLQIDKEPQSLQEVNSPQSLQPISFPDSQQALQAKFNARDRSHYVHSVLNPVENLSQWKEVKVRVAPVKNSEKENINSGLENVPFDLRPSMKVEKHQNSNDSAQVANISLRREISVDTSLSTWLVSSENSTQEGPRIRDSPYSNSSRSREEQPILGALTVEDIKQSSVTSSPRRSPSKNPDEIPILGAMGTYWRCKDQEINSSSSAQSLSEPKGIPNSTSKYREDKRVNWHSTPFEVRLERALNQGATS